MVDNAIGNHISYKKNQEQNDNYIGQSYHQYVAFNSDNIDFYFVKK